jgi:hypothetical protein
MNFALIENRPLFFCVISSPICRRARNPLNESLTHIFSGGFSAVGAVTGRCDVKIFFCNSRDSSPARSGVGMTQNKGLGIITFMFLIKFFEEASLI